MNIFELLSFLLFHFWKTNWTKSLLDFGIYIVQFALCIIYLFVFHWFTDFDTSFTMNYLKIIISSTPILIYLARQWPQHNSIEPCSINRQQFWIVDSLTHSLTQIHTCGACWCRQIIVIQYMLVYHTHTHTHDSKIPLALTRSSDYFWS